MDKVSVRRLCSALLALFLTAGVLPGPAYAAQPDFQVQPQGVQSGAGGPEAVFRIINLGADNGGSTVARIERLDKAGISAKDYPIPRLKVNEFADIRYALADPCPTIRLKVTADAKTDVRESNEGNNVWQGALQCPPGPGGGVPGGPPGSGVPGGLGPVGTIEVDPDSGLGRLARQCAGLFLPAECTIELDPMDLMSVRVMMDLDSGAISYWVRPLGQPGYENPAVGYWAEDERQDMSAYWQTGVLFDLSEISRYQKKFINQAVLEYIEILPYFDNKDQYGNQLGERTCANRVGKVTHGWGPGTQLRALDNDPIEALHLRNLIGEGEAFQGAHVWRTRHDFSVTQAVQNWLAFPSENYGLVLMGDNETFPRNQERCVGYLSDLKLTVEFTVLER